MKIEQKIMTGSVLSAFAVWMLDAFFDAVLFKKGSFIEELFFEVGGHELYFRSFSVASLLIFGFAIARMMGRRRQAEQQVSIQAAAMESSMDGMVVYDADEVYVYANQSYALINGYDSPADIIGKTCRDIYGDGEYERMQTAVIPVLQRTGRWRGELVGRRKNGSTYFQEASVSLLAGGGRVCVVRDITWRKRSEERLQRSERFLNTIFNSIRDPFCIFDDEFRIIRVNEAYANLKNKPLSELIGRNCYEVLEGRDSACPGCVVDKTFHSGDPCAKDKMVRSRDGTETAVEIYTYPILDEEGEVSHVIEYTRDITERRKAEDEKRRLIERLEHLSRTDELTGLINRRALTDSLAYEMDRAKRYGSPLSLVLCDVDNFKEINDRFGHDAGDRALQMMSGTLKTMLRKSDIAGRYGGDEFMLILPETSLKGAESLAEKMLHEFRNSDLRFPDGRQISLSMSIGVSCMGGENETIDSLIKRGDDAMYASKQGGRDRVSVLGSND